MCTVVEVGTPVEVRCHPTCPWTGGWQVCEALVAGGGFAYRVREQFAQTLSSDAGRYQLPEPRIGLDVFREHDDCDLRCLCGCEAREPSCI